MITKASFISLALALFATAPSLNAMLRRGVEGLPGEEGLCYQAALLSTKSSEIEALRAKSREMTGLETSKASGSNSVSFHMWLESFFGENRNLLNKRVFINRSVEYDKEKLKADLTAWYKEFEKALTHIYYEGTVFKSNNQYPGTIIFSFKDFPNYVIKLRAWNCYPLGIFDTTETERKDCYCSPVSNYRISAHSYPLQLVSHVCYSEKIQEYLKKNGILNVKVPIKQIFEFQEDPSGEDALDDYNLCVVEERIHFDREFNDAKIAELRKLYSGMTKDSLKRMASYSEDQSVVANLARVVLATGLWDATVATNNIVFARDESVPGGFVAWILDAERPAFGDSNPRNFFHLDSAEVLSNADVGIDEILGWINHEADAAAPEEGPGGGEGAAADEGESESESEDVYDEDSDLSDASSEA